MFFIIAPLLFFSAGDWGGHRGVGCCTGVYQVQGWCRVASDITPPPFDFVFLGFLWTRNDSLYLFCPEISDP